MVLTGPVAPNRRVPPKYRRRLQSAADGERLAQIGATFRFSPMHGVESEKAARQPTNAGMKAARGWLSGAPDAYRGREWAFTPPRTLNLA